MPLPLVNGKVIAFAQMRAKSPLISRTSMCPLAAGHALQSRHPREGWICIPHCQVLPKPQRQASGLQSLEVPVGLVKIREESKAGRDLKGVL